MYCGSVARALAATDPDRAERVARSIRDRGARASALAGIATAQAKTDPGRAERLLDLTGQLVRMIKNAGERATVLVDVAQEVSNIDDVRAMDLLDEAERVTASIIEEYARQEAQTLLVKVLGWFDPGRAERVALSIADAHARSFALMNLAQTLLRTVDP